MQILMVCGREFVKNMSFLTEYNRHCQYDPVYNESGDDELDDDHLDDDDLDDDDLDDDVLDDDALDDDALDDDELDDDAEDAAPADTDDIRDVTDIMSSSGNLQCLGKG